MLNDLRDIASSNKRGGGPLNNKTEPKLYVIAML